MKYVELIVHTTTQAADIVASLFFSMGCQGVTILDKQDLLDIIANSFGGTKSGYGQAVNFTVAGGEQATDDIPTGGEQAVDDTATGGGQSNGVCGENQVFWDYIDEGLLENSSDVVKVSSIFLLAEYSLRRRELQSELEALRQMNTAEFCGSLEIVTRHIDSHDWENNWKKYYKPIVVGDIQIIPEWLRGKEEAGKTIIYLDPEMAFGTGEHETTYMCIEMLQKAMVASGQVLQKVTTLPSSQKQMQVYDIGCGSGILGIAAAKLGASAAMTDIDPTAVLTARANAQKNGVGDKVEVFKADIPDFEKSSADIVLANITADVLIKLSKNLISLLKKNGTLILSGIIDTRKESVVDCYVSQGLRLVEERKKGDWVCLCLTAQ